MMTESPITTPRLRLVLDSPEAVIRRLEEMPPEIVAELSPVWLARIRAATRSDPWLHGFSVRLLSSEEPIGSIGFKGPPADGVVEIAYSVDPGHQGNGYATEAARAMTTAALEDPEVRTVRAHTLREKNASTSILTKCGFEFLGEVVDPEDGPVWRWERKETCQQSES